MENDSVVTNELVEQLVFNDQGLVPVVAQEATTGRVLMLAWMNREALQHTLATGEATYFSRSRQALWTKGETSGNRQYALSLAIDCDGDSLLMKVDQQGPACHTGLNSCFDTRVVDLGKGPADETNVSGSND